MKSENKIHAGGFTVISGDQSPRLPPHSIEAEQHVLACCLLDGAETIGRCLEKKLAPEAFYSAPNRIVFGIIAELHRRSQPVSIEVLAEELNTRDLLAAVGGAEYLLKITAPIPTTAHAAYFLEKVRERWLLRELAHLGTEAAEQAQLCTAAPAELLEGYGHKLGRMLDYARAGEETLAQRAAAAFERTMKKVAGQQDRSRWLYTGLAMFDEKFGALDVNEEDWFNLFAGIQSSGKSTLTRQIADHNLAEGKKGMVFLLETSVGKWLELAACTAARVNGRHLDVLPPDQQATFTQKLRERHAWIGKNLWICDDIIPVETIVARIEEHTRRFGAPDFVVVDHLHLLRSRDKFKSREPEMGHIAKQLKRCFKRVNTAGLVAAQLNRESKKESNRRPACHDIRDSGEIEQAADRVVLIHTPDQDMFGNEQTKNQSRVMIELVQDKSRNGPTGHRSFWFDRAWTLVSDVGDKQAAASGATRAVSKAQWPEGKKNL